MTPKRWESWSHGWVLQEKMEHVSYPIAWITASKNREYLICTAYGEGRWTPWPKEVVTMEDAKAYVEVLVRMS